jgi:transcriptional regulator with XRE-family HTH domain
MSETTAQLVREARRGGGLTQRALGVKAGVTQPALAAIERSDHDTLVKSLERLIGAAGYGLFLLPTTSSAVASWADYIHESLRKENHGGRIAFRALIGLSDQLAAAAGPLRVALCVAPPAPCGEARYDAALAALADYHLAKDGLPIPDWVHDPARSLDEPWEATPYTEISEVPLAFRRRGVLLAESELASV